MSNRSVVTNLLEFFETVSDKIDHGPPVDVIYLDYLKALTRLHTNDY